MLGFPMPRVPLVWGPVTSYRALDRQPLTLAHNLVKREAAECETGRKGTALAKSARGGGNSLPFTVLTHFSCCRHSGISPAQDPQSTKAGWPLSPPSLPSSANCQTASFSVLFCSPPLQSHVHSELCLVLRFTGRAWATVYISGDLFHHSASRP